MAEGSREAECGASDQAPVHSRVRQHVCEHAMLECARTCMNVGYVEPLSYVLTCSRLL